VVRRSASDRTEGPRQGALIDSGHAAEVGNVRRACEICVCDPFEMRNDLSVAADLLRST